MIPSPSTPAIYPAWFAERQLAAWQTFQSLAMPKRGDEQWRFSSFAKASLDGLELERAVPAPNDITKHCQGTESAVARLVFLNHSLVLSESKLPAEVICLPLAEALISHSDLVEKYFMQRETRLGSAKFAALHASHVKNGVFLHVPEGVQLDGNVEIFHLFSGVNSISLPHSLIVTGKDAAVRVVETFQNLSESDQTLVIAVNDLIAADGSTLDYVALQQLNQNSRIITINAAETAKSASSTNFLLSTGASWSRNEFLSRLEGEGARSNMLAVSVPGWDQEYDQRTYQHHVSPGAYSDLLYKNSLYDASRTIFSGLIFVDEGAHRTDAYQTCRNLFMSDKADANSMPGLEINADDVKCSHGSTSSRISDDEIFYLRARGVHEDRARQLIARGFSVEVISRLNHEPTESLILSALDLKFAAMKV
jgi:Fe-S cluster assembly protein SufD